MLTPRPYLSFSQMVLFDRDPDLYADQYIYGKKIAEFTGIPAKSMYTMS